jgi:hypothetical protein
MGVKTTPNDYIETLYIEDPITLPKTKLEIENLPILQTIGHVNVDKTITIDRSLKGTRLKTPVSFPVDWILQLGEKGLAEYILSSLVKSRPLLIPWILENQSLINLATHLLRSCSRSEASLYAYSNDVNIYVRRFRLKDNSADRLMSNVRLTKRGRIQVDSVRLENVKDSLAKILAGMHDAGLAPGRLKGFARHVRTWYAINNVEVPKPKTIPRGHVVNKDRSPTQQELQTLLDSGDLREKVILSMLAGGGFREETLTKMVYSHIREDLEANKVPLHIHVDVEIVKGHYADYDTFLPQETVDYLRLYLEQRKKGTPPQWRKGQPIKYVPPEEIRDGSPLIRNTESAAPKPVGPKNIYRIIHRLYDQTGLLKKNKTGHYNLRVHSLRKFFKTQLVAAGVPESHADYMMGHVGDEYNQVQDLGVEKLREIYSKAGLTLRPRSYVNKVEMTKDILERILSKLNDQDKREVIQSFAEPHRTLGNQEAQDDHEIGRLVNAIVDRLRTRSGTTPQNPPAS